MSRPALSYLCFLGLSLAPAADRLAAAPAMLTVLLDCEQDDVANRLVRAATRVICALEPIAERVLAIVTPAPDDEVWAENDRHVRDLERVLALLQAILADGEFHADLSSAVLPVLLRTTQHRGKSFVAPVREKLVLKMVHSFYASPKETSVLQLWQSMEQSEPDLALELLCRVSEHLKKAHRYRELLVLPQFWCFLYQRMEECGLHKNIPLARSKQAMYVLREAVEMCAVEKVTVVAEPWIRWRPKDNVGDWESYIALFELLEQYSLHLIEPAWPLFDKIAIAGNVPPLLLQLLVRRGLGHDSVHVTRMILVFLFQSKQEALRWITPDFFCGPLLSSLMLPSLYRGVSGMVFPGLAYAFWQRQFSQRPDDLDALVTALVPELYPSNPKLHHNVFAVPVLLNMVAETRLPCIGNVRQAGKVLLLGRSHYCPIAAWQLVIECLNMAEFKATPAELFARMRPHAVELIRDNKEQARRFFAKSGLLKAELPVEEDAYMACCVYAAANPAEATALLMRSKTPDEVLSLVAAMCPSMDVCLDLLCGGNVAAVPDLPQSACAFALRGRYEEGLWSRVCNQANWSDVDAVVRALTWIKFLSDESYLSRAVGARDGNASEAKASVALVLSSFALSPESAAARRRLSVLQWHVLSQLAAWLRDKKLVEQIARHAGVFLANCENHVEFEALRFVFECCAASASPTVFGDAVTSKELLQSLRDRFDEIVFEHENRDAVDILSNWARVAFGEASRRLGLAPTCLEMLQGMELQHHRFEGVVGAVVEQHFVPRWRSMDTGDADIEQEAELLVLLLRQGYERDESRKLDQEADEGAHRRAFSLPRAYATAFLDVFRASERGGRLATRVVTLLLRRALAVKQALDAGREADRVATQFSGSPAHLMSIRTWQAACLAAGKMSDDAKDCEEIADTTLLLLDGFHLPSLTVYLENFLVTFCRAFPRFVPKLLLANLADFYQRSAHTKTVMGAAFVLANSGSVVGETRQQLIAAMLPYLNAVQHPVRSRAVFACVEWAKKEWLMAGLSEASRACVEMVASYCVRCTDVPRKVMKSEDDWLLKYVQQTPSLKLLLFDIPTKAPEIISESFMPDVIAKAHEQLGSAPFAIAEPATEALPLQKRSEEAHGAQLTRDIRGAAADDYQTKMIPWHMLRLDEAESRESVVNSSRRLPMVVCASLLDRAPNIGGLTRTCEVMGLEAIVIGDLKVMQTKDYTAVAVTAEKWIKTEAVTPEALPQWLLHMKNDRGYALVGLEQTKDSVSIVDFKFPRKCVLVLGNELKGMPAPLISMLDLVVEIPQRGTIRSLNVHVSASIMIAQYCFQQGN